MKEIRCISISRLKQALTLVITKCGFYGLAASQLHKGTPHAANTTARAAREKQQRRGRHYRPSLTIYTCMKPLLLHPSPIPETFNCWSMDQSRAILLISVKCHAAACATKCRISPYRLCLHVATTHRTAEYNMSCVKKSNCIERNIKKVIHGYLKKV